MSIEEQDQIFGRLSRQERESKKALAALQTRISEISKDLATASDKLGRTVGGFDQISYAIEAIQSITDKESMLKTLGDLREERTNLERIQQQLKQFD